MSLPPELVKAKGLKRVGQLLSGDRAWDLGLAAGMARADTATNPGLHAHAQHLKSLADDEIKKVLVTRGAAGATGLGAAGVGLHALHKHQKNTPARKAPRQKVATVDQVRRDARRAAGHTDALRGGLAGGLGALALSPSKTHIAGGAALGALLGRTHGRAAFNKRELAQDLHMERALIKGQRDRSDKASEKLSAELSDVEMALLYGL